MRIFLLDMWRGRISRAKLAIWGLPEAYFFGRSGAVGAKINEKQTKKRNFASD